MKRLALCVDNVNDYLGRTNHSLVLINPRIDPVLRERIITRADCDSVIDEKGHRHIGNGGTYPDEAVVFTTSGSTGDVKLCAFTQAQLDLKAQHIAGWFELSANDRYVSMVPLFNTYGLPAYLAALKTGMEVNVVDARSLRDVPKLHPTFLMGTPRILEILQGMKFGPLRFVRSATEPLSLDRYHSFCKNFATTVINTYGMTEALGACLSNPLHGPPKPGTVGLPLGTEAMMVSGELHLRGPTFFQAGWYATGDLAARDEDGHYTIVGRQKDLIKINGQTIVPAQVEALVAERFPNIGTVVVFGAQSINIIYDGDCDRQALSDSMRSICLGYRPSMIERVPSIPRAASGKISRTLLAQTFAAD